MEIAGTPTRTGLPPDLHPVSAASAKRPHWLEHTADMRIPDGAPLVDVRGQRQMEIVMRNRRKAIIAAVAAGLAVALAAGLVLTSGSEPADQPAADSVLLSPFTGEPVPALGPVLAVKIDNIAQARPQTGLSKADIVYVLPVEGGLTRLLAVYSSDSPSVIGPVRSAREADLELLAQFGQPAFAYSGATPRLLPVIGEARIVDLYSGKADGYFRDASRPAPHNLYAHASRLLEQARTASKAHDIGFRFGPAPNGRSPPSRCPIRPPHSSSPGRQARTAGWSRWTRHPRSAPKTASSRPPP